MEAIDKAKVQQLFDKLFPTCKLIIETSGEQPPLFQIHLWEPSINPEEPWLVMFMEPLPMESSEDKAMVAVYLSAARRVMAPSECGVFMAEAWLKRIPVEGRDPAEAVAQAVKHDHGDIAGKPGTIEVLHLQFFGQGFTMMVACEIEKSRETISGKTLKKAAIVDVSRPGMYASTAAAPAPDSSRGTLH